MAARLAEIGVVTLGAVIITAALALPVLRAPSARIFGAEIVGRHHDPFTVMQQLARPVSVGVFAQPVSDLPAAALTRVTGAVAAYNWLVLISFPLTAAACFLLARYLLLSPAAATLAALACAFSPFHLAHAAYHPHIAQIQWLPLYLCALWWCLDTATLRAAVVLGAAVIGVMLSNFYGGLIAAVVSPVALLAYWTVTRRTGPLPLRRLCVTIGTLLVMTAVGSGYAWWAAAPVLVDREAYAFPPLDLLRYSARWWSYLLPPVAHPWLGPPVARFWAHAGVDRGLLEQQLSLGWGVVVLALIACGAWAVSRRPAPLTRVPVLAAVAAVAFFCSLSPEVTIGHLTVWRPSAFLYEALPMFRSFARFGVVVQLMAVLLAGIGVDLLWRARLRLARPLCVTLVALVMAEYVVMPSQLWRDVMPTRAHRWVMQQESAVRTLDCVPLTEDSASVQWLSGARIVSLGGTITDCGEPNLAHKLAANGFTHLLLRRDRDRQLTAPSPTSGGFQLAATLGDGDVFSVATASPAIFTETMVGFSPRERDQSWSWQWMGAHASWTIVNTTPQLATATLEVDVSAFGRDRDVAVSLDRAPAVRFTATPAMRTYRLGPFLVPRGAHELAFQALELPTVADALLHNRDRRPLSIAIGSWTWLVSGAEP